MKELDWNVAESRLTELLKLYKELPPQSGFFGVTMLEGLRRRFDKGERTPQLHNEIMQSE